MRIDQEQQLIEIVGKTKKIIDVGYQELEAAFMKRDNASEAMKEKLDQYSRERTNELQDAIEATLEEEMKGTIDTVKAAIQEQKAAYMKVVNDFYRPNGKYIDLDDSALLNSGMDLQNDELYDMIMKHIDNCTMLRLILKYCTVNKLINLAEGTSKLPDEVADIMHRVHFAGSREEKAFDTFVHLASMGLMHPDRHYPLYQARLDDYEEDAVIAIKKAALLIDDRRHAELEQLIYRKMEKHNDAKNELGLDWTNGGLALR